MGNYQHHQNRKGLSAFHLFAKLNNSLIYFDLCQNNASPTTWLLTFSLIQACPQSLHVYYSSSRPARWRSSTRTLDEASDISLHPGLPRWQHQNQQPFHDPCHFILWIFILQNISSEVLMSACVYKDFRIQPLHVMNVVWKLCCNLPWSHLKE